MDNKISIKGITMSDMLNKLILDINTIHEHLLKNEQIDNLNYILNFVDDYDSEVKEQYLKLLLRFYFQNNQIQNLKELYSLGYRFDLRIEDIKSALLNISSNDENVIEFLQDDVLFSKYKNYRKSLEEIYSFYVNANSKQKENLEFSINLLRKNIYICAYSYKNKNHDFAYFFLDESLLSTLKDDLPFLFK